MSTPKHITISLSRIGLRPHSNASITSPRVRTILKSILCLWALEMKRKNLYFSFMFKELIQLSSFKYLIDIPLRATIKKRRNATSKETTKQTQRQKSILKNTKTPKLSLTLTNSSKCNLTNPQAKSLTSKFLAKEPSTKWSKTSSCVKHLLFSGLIRTWSSNILWRTWGLTLFMMMILTMSFSIESNSTLGEVKDSIAQRRATGRW